MARQSRRLAYWHGEALLSVDDQLLGRGVVLVAEADGVQQVADVAVLPREGALKAWQADPPLRYPLLTTTNLFFGIFYSAYCFC